MANAPDSVRFVIIGGGIGCSVAYYLAKLAWKNVVLRLLYQEMVR
ncbi:MAG: glycine/D-amino acid oxidase-like deaminating enzyme [Zhongshania sp.]|jgi:glycine/D-amino acid oxidase-like deaminating enzyme